MNFNFTNINMMNNNEILEIFKNDEIPNGIKNTIVNDYYERISRLPNHLFNEVLPFISKPNILLEKYQNKLNTLSYDELVSLIYDDNFEQECLLAVVKLEIFQHYLNIEKENKKNDKLQTFYLSSKLFLSDNNDDLFDISNEISNILNSKNNYSEEFMYFIEIFLSEISDKINDIDEKVINSCLSILSKTISNNMLLTREMLKFYTLYRLNELNLFGVCNDVIILEDNNSNQFGNYNYGRKEIKIFYNYIYDLYLPLIRKMNISDIENFNSLFNKEFIFLISHELGHVVDNKKRLNIIGLDNLGKVTEDSFSDSFSIYAYRSTMLRSFIGRDNYHKHHDEFIDENRADLFAIIDSSKQMNSIFKGAFSSDDLQKFSNYFANKIINLYTEVRGNEVFVISPSEKFDRFANSFEGISFKNDIKNISYENDIYNDLLLGNPIPFEILVRVLDVAKGNIVTNNLNDEILDAIELYNIEKNGVAKK